jgi:hypothetical protein
MGAMRMRLVTLAALLLASSSGCTLVFDDGGGPDAGSVCNGGSGDDTPFPSNNAGGVATPVPGDSLRNPDTGQCIFTGCSGDIPVASPQPEPGTGQPRPSFPTTNARAAPQDWGSCNSMCGRYDEDTCRLADGCRAIYLDACGGAADCTRLVFSACWPTAPSGPVHGGACPGLAAQECSRHDDCIAVHQAEGAQPTRFRYCLNESAPASQCDVLSETECIGRSDCAPLYQGSDCTCTSAGCHCASQFFVACSDGGASADLECGPYHCRSDQYCEHGEGGAPPGINNYACKPMPAGCTSCDCMKNQPCGFECMQSSTGITLTCQYP